MAIWLRTHTTLLYTTGGLRRQADGMIIGGLWPALMTNNREGKGTDSFKKQVYEVRYPLSPRIYSTRTLGSPWAHGL